jgi:hypothetical protein
MKAVGALLLMVELMTLAYVGFTGEAPTAVRALALFLSGSTLLGLCLLSTAGGKK